MKTVNVELPDDAFTPGRMEGFDRVEVIVRCPSAMTPERFAEIAAGKRARVYPSIWACGFDPAGYWYEGPVLEASWEENGAKVVMKGPVDVDGTVVSGGRRAGGASA